MLDFPVRETTLDNGLKVLTVEHHEAPVVGVWIYYRVGSRNEQPGITGISHWTEHMCFKGGKQFGKGDIFKEVAKVGGYNNGMTGNDYTVYFEAVPSDHADLGLRIEADRMAASVFDPDEVASERTVIISEREGAENYPQFLLGEEVSLAAFRTHPYRWSVVGWKADLREITREDLWDYYKRHYAPDNAVLIVAGDFQTDSMMGQIEEHFGSIDGHADVAPIRSTEPPQEGERRVSLRRPGTASYLQIAYHLPAGSHEDAAALRVLNSVLTGTPPLAWLSPDGGGVRTARIYKGLVETELALGAGCSVVPRQADPGLGAFYATVRVGVEEERVEQAMLDIIEQARSQAPSETEMQKAKTQLAASMAYAGESANGIASMLGTAEMVDSHTTITQLAARVAAVTADDVLRVAQTYLGEGNRTVGWFIPSDGPTDQPSGGGDAAGMPDSPQAFQSFYFTGLSGLSNAERKTLDNGLRVVAYPSRMTPSVYVRGFMPGAGNLDRESVAGRARFAATTMQRGTRTRNYQEIFEAIDAVGATFGTYAASERGGFGGVCLAEHLGMWLDTAADAVINPSFPEKEVGKVRTEILTVLRQDDDSTRVVATREARALLYPEGHPYRIWESGLVDTITRMSRDELVAFHQAGIRPERAVITVVGDIDPSEAISMVDERFGSWRPEGEAPEWPDLSAQAPDAMRTKCVKMASKTQCDIVIGWPAIPRTAPDFYAYQFATMILGQLGFMGRYGDTVRDKLGLAYYCFSAMPETYGDGMWLSQAGVSPANVKLAIDTMLEQMRLMQDELVSEQEYDDLIQNQLGAMAMRMEAKSRISAALEMTERWDLGADFYERYPEIVRSVSREDIQEAARKYFHPDNHVLVVAGPECEIE